MHNLPAWILDDPHALKQLLVEEGFTVHDEDTPP
jgi:hypothetical protein